MKRDTPQRVFSTNVAVLMLAAFTGSLGFGVVLPLLPMMVEQLAVDGGDPRRIAQATGLLTGLNMLSLFAFALRSRFRLEGTRRIIFGQRGAAQPI